MHEKPNEHTMWLTCTEQFGKSSRLEKQLKTIRTNTHYWIYFHKSEIWKKFRCYRTSATTVLPQQFTHSRALQDFWMTTPSCRNYHPRRRVPSSICRMWLCSPLVQLSSCRSWGPCIPSVSPNNPLIPGPQINFRTRQEFWKTMTMTPPSCRNYHPRRRVPSSIRRMWLCSTTVQPSSCERWDPYVPSFSPNNSLIASSDHWKKSELSCSSCLPLRTEVPIYLQFVGTSNVNIHILKEYVIIETAKRKTSHFAQSNRHRQYWQHEDPDFFGFRAPFGFYRGFLFGEIRLCDEAYSWWWIL